MELGSSMGELKIFSTEEVGMGDAGRIEHIDGVCGWKGYLGGNKNIWDKVITPLWTLSFNQSIYLI